MDRHDRAEPHDTVRHLAEYEAEEDRLRFPYFVDQFDPKPDTPLPLEGLTGYVLRTGDSLLVDPPRFAREAGARPLLNPLARLQLEAGADKLTSLRPSEVVDITAMAEESFKGLTLFFTELWERFSYYGMRALLILYMTAAVTGDNPGMGLDVATAGAIYGLYTGLVYLLALPGGWVADNLWGQRRSVFVGGCIIAAGHFSMAVPSTFTFFLGLVLIVCGTGLLKPNVSTVVGELYPEGGARRDAGFSIFYMGINLGAFLAPLVCGGRTAATRDIATAAVVE